MPFPFPGMDPWLERPGLWPDVHDSLILALRRALAPMLRPRYYIAVRQRTVLAVEPATLYPDVVVAEGNNYGDHGRTETAGFAEPVVVAVPAREPFTENYLEIVESSTHRVVTVIEILSPSNKQPGEDRRLYEIKRERLFRSLTNLVEIDLLREGEPMPFVQLQSNGQSSDYRILVKRGELERRAHLYPFNLRGAVPMFPLPLHQSESEPPVRLGELLREIYDEGGYDLRIDYTQAPSPPLSESEAEWARNHLQTRGILAS